MLRTFHLDCGIDLHESNEPDTVILDLRPGVQRITMTREDLIELGSLARYHSYGDSINWVEPPTQEEMPLGNLLEEELEQLKTEPEQPL